MGEPVVLELGALHRGMGDLVGGKAASLGDLLDAGFPVPPGFCVTTGAYADVAGQADLDRLLDELDATAADDVARVADLAGEVRRRLLATPVPAAVATAVEQAYASLGDGVAVAVRSSATAEDQPHASFAGQHDSYLNVVGAPAVLDAVRRCWASLWTERAVAYRAAAGVDHRTVRLAVVVQRMVDAAVAGVLFTANPVTGRRRQAVIDAGTGLGEAVVSGAVDPDRVIADLGTGRVESRDPETGQCLDDEQVAVLVDIGRRVEAHYGSPQDTEWAIDAAGVPWLTQARPVTSLYPLPAGAPDPDDELRVYVSFSVAQGVERPLTPVGLAGFRLLATSLARMFRDVDEDAGPDAYREAGMRVFIDATRVLRSRVGSRVAPRMLDLMEARSAAVLRSLQDDPRLPADHPSLRPLLRVARGLLRARVPFRAVAALRDPDAALRRVTRLGERLADAVETPPDATATHRLDRATELLRRRVVPVIPAVLPPAAAGFLMLALAARLLRDDAEPGELQAVLRGLPHNVTTEMDLALWQVATRIGADDAAARLVRDEPPADLARRYRDGTLPVAVSVPLEEFLDRYGHRAVAEIDLGMPRWSDDPTHVLGVLGNYLRLDDPALAPDAQFERANAEAVAAVTRLVGKARRRGRLRGATVRFALDRLRRLAGLRELPKSYVVFLLAGVRRQVLAVGAELASAGRLDAAADACFLDFAELRDAVDGADLRGVVAARKLTYGHELRRRQVPRVLLSDGTAPEPARPAGAAGLTGTAASAGSVTARARVVLEPVGARLEPGEILVAPSTDPGWTPLFLTAGALVMEMGGPNSHGAVVAREYGIPAVVGVSGATRELTTGQLVTVDGAAGTVRVESSGDVDQVREDDDVVDVVAVREGAATGDQP